MGEWRWKAGSEAARVALILVSLLVARPAAAQPADRWSSEIAEASARFGIPAEWIRRVIQAESDGRTTWLSRPIVSRAGAMGLMQLMPGTWRDMRALHGFGPDPHDPHDNILAGTAYLRAMYDRFGYPGLFAAYNAGPARYSAHLVTRRPLPAETIAYVAEVAAAGLPRAQSREAVRTQAAFRKQIPTVFVALPGARPPDHAVTHAAANSLFVKLGMASNTSD